MTIEIEMSAIHKPGEPEASGREPQALELQSLLAIYQQKYQHARHAQTLRTTHFHLYLAFAGAAVAALVTLHLEVQSEDWWAFFSVGAVLWIMGVLSMARAERWTGHIIHDLVLVRRVERQLHASVAAVRPVLRLSPKTLSGLEFDRPLLSRGRSIEASASIVGSMIGAVVMGLELPFSLWMKVVFGLACSGFSYWQWRAETAYQKRRHQDCCIGVAKALGDDRGSS